MLRLGDEPSKGFLGLLVAFDDRHMDSYDNALTQSICGRRPWSSCNRPL